MLVIFDMIHLLCGIQIMFFVLHIIFCSMVMGFHFLRGVCGMLAFSSFAINLGLKYTFYTEVYIGLKSTNYLASLMISVQ